MQRPQGIEESAQRLFPGSRATDMQFNIGRIEGSPMRGADLIDPASKSRVYVAAESDPEAEDKIAKYLGSDAILPRVNTIDGLAVYQVPDSAQLLVKLLKQGPYASDYMAMIANRSGALLRALTELDPTAFGVSLQDVAVISQPATESDDDMVLTVVPPVIAASDRAVTLDDVEFNASFQIPENLFDDFSQGLRRG